MITIRTAKGKFFFSSFISLSEEKEAQIDETLLSLLDLKYLLTAIETTRLESSIDDLDTLKATIVLRESSSGESGVDPSVLLTKEDKINKVKVFGVGSDISYPTTNAVKSFVSAEITSLNLTTYAKTSVVNTSLDLKADKTQLNNYALKTEIPSLEQTSGTNIAPILANKIPLYSLGTDGNFVLCTPSAWIKLDENLFMPAYTGEVLGLYPIQPNEVI